MSVRPSSDESGSEAKYGRRPEVIDLTHHCSASQFRIIGNRLQGKVDCYSERLRPIEKPSWDPVVPHQAQHVPVILQIRDKLSGAREKFKKQVAFKLLK